MIEVAPSLLAADLSRLAWEVERLGDSVSWLHLDIMDGHYVPNLSFGPPVVASLRKHTRLFLDCHLMVVDPLSLIGPLAEAGADRISFHPEVVEDPLELLEGIKAHGLKAGLALSPQVAVELAAPYVKHLDVVIIMTVNPGFSGQAFMEELLPKVREAAALLERAGRRVELMVDGGVNEENVTRVAEAGATVVAAGNSVFSSPDPRAQVEILRARAEMAQR